MNAHTILDPQLVPLNIFNNAMSASIWLTWSWF